MRTGRKVLAILLAVVMVLSLAGCTPGGKIETAPPESTEPSAESSTASTEPSEEPQSASWEYKDGVLTISGEGTVGNYVDGIAPWEEHKAEITSIVIGEGITRVEGHAFEGLENVTEVSGGENVTYVAGTAFEDTPWYRGEVCKLGSCFVKWAEDFANIFGSKLFLNGYSYICAGAFFGAKGLEEVNIPANTYISSDAFAFCEDLYSINISSDTGEDDAVAISADAFRGSYWLNSQLDSIQYTDGYIFLGNNLVMYVGESDHIAIPAGTTSIGGRAFIHNQNLSSVTIPVSVKKISVAAFDEMIGTAPYLEDIYYEGSEDEWNAIEFFEDAEPSYSFNRPEPTIHYNSSMPE